MSAIIYSHCDFDGAASAALVSYVTGIENFKFATPENIRQQGVSGIDYVCDLPYISGCGYWFDHHESNIQELKDRGLNPDNLAGFAIKAPSAAQVIYDHYSKDVQFPVYLKELVEAANIVDTMGYESIEDWLTDSPYNILNETININSETYPAMTHHLNWLTNELREKSMQEICESEKIIGRYQENIKARNREIELIRKIHAFMPQDTAQKLMLIDCTKLAYLPKFNKNLALVVNPHVDYTLLIASDFKYGRKTNNIKLSLSKNFLKPDSKNLGEFLEELNIGGGHANAAGGMLRANSKKERDKKLDKFLKTLYSFLFEE